MKPHELLDKVNKSCSKDCGIGHMGSCGHSLTSRPDMEPRAVKMEWEKRRECGVALCEARHCVGARGHVKKPQGGLRRRTHRGL